MLARIKFYEDLVASGIEARLVQTIHDSIVVDTPKENVYTISRMLKNAVEAVPELCVTHFNYKFSLPLFCEILVGPNKKDLVELEGV